VTPAPVDDEAEEVSARVGRNVSDTPEFDRFEFTAGDT
jgi:hypothetical protein